MELFKKIYIKSEADLPQSERAMYFVGVKDNLNPEDLYEWFNYKNPVMAYNQAEYWINTFDWYLQPIEEQESKPEFNKAYLDECIEKAAPNLSKIKDVDKELAEIKDESQITDSDIEAYLIEHYKPIFIDGGDGTDVNQYFRECAKNCMEAVLNGEIKHIEK
jgi:hypothetical protein